MTHASSLEEVMAEKILDLKDKVIEASNLEEYLEMIADNNNKNLTDLAKLPTALIKGFIFTYFTVTNNIE